MKKILLLAAIALSSLSVKAQTEPGTFTLMPKVGLNMATTGEDDAKMKPGAVAGVEAEYRVSNLIGVSAGVLYSMQGAKWSEGDYTSKVCADYINIPIMANFYVWKGLALSAGIQPGFMVSAKNKWDNGDRDIKDGCESFDFSIPVGVSYEWNDFVLGVRYNIGVTDMYKVEEGVEDDDNGKNGVLAITLGYKFAL